LPVYGCLFDVGGKDLCSLRLATTGLVWYAGNLKSDAWNCAVGWQPVSDDRIWLTLDIQQPSNTGPPLMCRGCLHYG